MSSDAGSRLGPDEGSWWLAYATNGAWTITDGSGRFIALGPHEWEAVRDALNAVARGTVPPTESVGEAWARIREALIEFHRAAKVDNVGLVNAARTTLHNAIYAYAGVMVREARGTVPGEPERCPQCGAIAHATCDKCGAEWFNRTQSLAHSEQARGEASESRSTHEKACVDAVGEIAHRLGLEIVNEASQFRPNSMSYVKPSELADRIEASESRSVPQQDSEERIGTSTRPGLDVSPPAAVPESRSVGASEAATLEKARVALRMFAIRVTRGIPCWCESPTVESDGSVTHDLRCLACRAALDGVRAGEGPVESGVDRPQTPELVNREGLRSTSDTAATPGAPPPVPLTVERLQELLAKAPHAEWLVDVELQELAQWLASRLIPQPEAPHDDRD